MAKTPFGSYATVPQQTTPGQDRLFDVWRHHPVFLTSDFQRHCCISEEEASVTVDCARSDGERQLGERSREPMPRAYVSGKFVVATANILDQGVADADHPY